MEVSVNKAKWLVVVNVFAASRKAGSIWKGVASCMEEHGIDYKARYTGGEGNATAITMKACAEGFREFVAVGGDGTIHDVLNGIALYVDSHPADVRMSDFTLAVLPVGSGNDWIKTFGVPRDINAAVSILRDGCAVTQDVVRVTKINGSGSDGDISYMANIAGIGLDSRVCEIVNRKKDQGQRGKSLYLSALMYCLKHRSPISARVICDGSEVFNGKYFSIAFGTGKYSGGGMRQTPLAVPDDGLIDVTIIPDIPLWIIATKIFKLFTGSFHTVKQLTLARCKVVEVYPQTQADNELVEVDGNIIGRAPVRMEVIDDQINIMVPSKMGPRQ